MTAAERLVALAGQSGAAGALLLLIGAGSTAGDALVNYSGLPTATAAVHLMTDVAVAPPSPQGRDYWDVTVIGVDKKPRKQDLGVMLLLLG